MSYVIDLGMPRPRGQAHVSTGNGQGSTVSGHRRYLADPARVHVRDARYCLGDVEPQPPGRFVMDELVPEGPAVGGGGIGDPHGLAAVTPQPPRKDPWGDIEFTDITLARLEEKDLPKQQHVLSGRPAVRHVAHVPHPERQSGEVVR